MNRLLLSLILAIIISIVLIYIYIPSSQDNSHTSHPIYYISTYEGISSHVRQLDILWNGALQVNRSIIAVSFHSEHFPELGPISLCDLFTLPKEISCIRADNMTIFKKKICYFTGAMFTPLHYYDINMETRQNFSYANIDCIAGFVNTEVGYPRIVKRMPMLSYPFFADKYLKLLPIAKKIMNITDHHQEYIVAHWRRGDQIVKCSENIKSDGSMRKHQREGKRDHSINCANSSDFIDNLLATINHHIPAEEMPPLIYTATNENDPMVLHSFSDHHIGLYSMIRDGMMAQGYYHLNALDEFMIELMILCDATYLFAWGDSSLHNFLCKCRILDTRKKHVTVIDDAKSMCHGHHINAYVQPSLSYENSSIIKDNDNNELISV